MLVSNQVTTRLAVGEIGPGESLDDFVTAALGNTWAHNVNTRIALEYLDEMEDSQQLRQMSIVKSPIAPGWHIPYVVTERGPEERAGGAAIGLLTAGNRLGVRSAFAAVHATTAGQHALAINHQQQID